MPIPRAPLTAPPPDGAGPSGPPRRRPGLTEPRLRSAGCRMIALAVAVATTRPVGVAQLARHEADVAAAPHHPPVAAVLAWQRGREELDLEVDRRRPLPGRQRGDQRRAKRVVEHRRQESALDVAGRVQELLGRRERDLDRPGLGSMATSRKPSSTADGGGSRRPSITSQKGPSRVLPGLLTSSPAADTAHSLRACVAGAASGANVPLEPRPVASGMFAPWEGAFVPLGSASGCVGTFARRRGPPHPVAGRRKRPNERARRADWVAFAAGRAARHSRPGGPLSGGAGGAA